MDREYPESIGIAVSEKRHLAAGATNASRQQETPLNWNHFIRQSHRWLSIAFTLTVVANFVARTRGEPSAWVTYSPLLPLFLLLLSGLYMFALPYVGRRARGAAEPRMKGQ